MFQEAAQALLSAQQVGCTWPNITDKIDEYLGRAEMLKQLRGGVAELVLPSLISLAYRAEPIYLQSLTGHARLKRTLIFIYFVN